MPTLPGDPPTSARPAGGPPRQPAIHQTTVVVRPWVDPVVDSLGHPPDGMYVELFWLGILGPTTTWLLRRLAAGLTAYPDGYELDLSQTAASLGLTLVPGRHSPFTRALERCVMFGVAHRYEEQRNDVLAVRRRVPWLVTRQVDRLPTHLRDAHAHWTRDNATSPPHDRSRATELAEALLRFGEEPSLVERHLVAVGVDVRLAREVLDAAAPTDVTGSTRAGFVTSEW